MSTDLITQTSQKAVTDILAAVKNMPIMAAEDHKFLEEHKEHLSSILQHSYMWRTDIQKQSIISDNYCPTIHSKFHQAILEQKVQFEQAMYLAKDFELKKLEVEELQCEIEQIEEQMYSHPDDISKPDGYAARHFKIQIAKKQVEMRFKEFELKQMQVAMMYRMKEVKGWQKLEDALLKKMKEDGLSEEIIWSKDAGEVTNMFFLTLSNLQGIKSSTDGGERNNLIALAMFSVKQVMELNILDKLKPMCNTLQAESLEYTLALISGKKNPMESFFK